MPRHWPRWSVLLPCLFVLAASAPMGRRLPHDAYIWQRHWTPALDAAMDQSADLVRAWRVLVAHADPDGVLHPIEPGWARLAASNRPIVAVIRLDGRIDRPGTLRDAVLARLQTIPVAVAGIEIDHDCPTARLPAYAALLADLRTALPPAMALSITVLPTWTRSPALPAVLAPLDEAVLQVHAVQAPQSGLFDPAQARRWIDAFDRRTVRPFRVALPAYGTRVTWAPNGRLLAVESERPALAGSATARELIAPPRAVAALLADLQADPPVHLAGIAWFRLPTADDRRAWTLNTWRAVIRGKPLAGAPSAIAEPAEPPGLYHLLLANQADSAASLPAFVTLSPACSAADGANDYDLIRTAGGLELRRRQPGLLPEHTRQLIGWMRCDPAPEILHVTP